MVNNGFDPEWLTPQRSPYVYCSSTDTPSGHYAALPGAAWKLGNIRALEGQGTELRLISRKPDHRATVTGQNPNTQHAHNNLSDEHRDEGELPPPQARGNMTGSRKQGMEGQVMFALKYGPLTVSKGPLQ